MDENKVKEVLRIEFLKELPEELVKSKVVKEQQFFVNDEGEITFSHVYWLQSEEGINDILRLINYLASKLADAQVDLWLRSHSSKRAE